MNELMQDSLYDTLGRLSTDLVQLYLVACYECQEQDDDGIRVAQNILYSRNFYNE